MPENKKINIKKKAKSKIAKKNAISKLIKTKINLARQLTYNTRYLGDIAVVNLKDFSSISTCISINHHIGIRKWIDTNT